MEKCNLKLIQNTDFSVDDVAKFILTEDEFETAYYWKDNFINYIKRLYKENSILIFTDGEIKGLMCFIFINKEDEDKINKIRWTIPENITSGKTLHVGVCILNEGCDMRQLTRYFEKLDYRKKFKEITWFRGGLFRRRLKNEN